ncbi:MAG: CPXCG motif-containing cysteine-rich protein [Pyrinomonadaceae bacterium]
MEIEYAFACPYCWQTITMVLDLSVAAQEYVEDCEVCCQPILIAYASDGEEVTSFEAQPE